VELRHKLLPCCKDCVIGFPPFDIQAPVIFKFGWAVRIASCSANGAPGCFSP
jgi:hypothetical protein